MRSRLRTILTLSLALTSAASWAQSIQIDTKYGNVSMEEVSMTSYPPDTSATALYLYRNDEILMDFTANGLKRNTLFRRRIKILKEDGRDCADFHIRYNASNSEIVGGVKVTTFNFENGKITETKAGKECIFQKDIDKEYKELSFTAQNVKVGSVIEVQYRKSSPAYYYIPDIFFQFDIPVNMAEATVSYPDFFHFSRAVKGFDRLTTDRETESKTLNLGSGASLVLVRDN